jgi:NitT/TauT family transport system substrate-binding protein
MSTLRVGLTDWIAYSPFYLAHDLGYYADNDIELSFKLESEVRYRLFRERKLDCITTSINAFCLESVKVDAQIILALIQVKQPGSERIVAQTSFQSIQDLQNATICYVPNGLEHFYFHYFFKQAGIPLPEKILKAQTREEMRDLLRVGEADAVVLFAPYLEEFISKDAYHVVPNNADLSVVIAVLVAHRSAIEKSDRQLRALVRGYFQALTYFDDFREDALIRLLRYFRARIENPLEDLQRKFVEGFRYLDQRENHEIFMRPERILHRAINESVAIWQEISSATETINIGRLIEPAYAMNPEAIP